MCPKPIENSQSFSCTISTENNSGKVLNLVYEGLALAAKALESKHPKFMRTIEETSTHSNRGEGKGLKKTSSSGLSNIVV